MTLVVVLLRVRNLLRCLFGDTLNALMCCRVLDILLFELCHFWILNLFRHGCPSLHHDEPCPGQFLVSFALPFSPTVQSFGRVTIAFSREGKGSACLGISGPEARMSPAGRILNPRMEITDLSREQL